MALCYILLLLLGGISASQENRKIENVSCQTSPGNSTIENIFSPKHFQECLLNECKSGYYKLNFTVRRATGNSTCLMNVLYDSECAENEDIAVFHAKKELASIEKSLTGTCNPRSKVQSCTGASSTLPECNLTFSNQTSEQGYRLSVTFQSDSTSTQFAVAAIVTSLQADKRFDDDYFLCKDTPIVIVDAAHKTATQVIFRVIQDNPLRCIKETVRIKRVSRVCAFFNASSQLWNSSVCEVRNVFGNETECFCHHNSAFAVVFSLTTIQLDENFIKFGTACEIASIIALVITAILLFLYRRKLRNFDRVLVQISLCTSMAMTHIFLLLSQVAITNNAFCQATIVVSHYFLVTTTVFMVMEGSLILIKVLNPNFGGSSNAKSRRVKGFVIGWIIPLVYVTICAGFGIKNGSYGNFINEADRYEVCWITDSLNLVVIIPVAVGLTINVLIIIRLALLVANLSHKAEKFKPTSERDYNPLTHARKAIRAIVILCPILGAPWIIGFFINIGPPTDIAFASIHAIINGCQGIYIFLHYIVFNSDIKDALKRYWKNATQLNNSSTYNQVVFSTTNNQTG